MHEQHVGRHVNATIDMLKLKGRQASNCAMKRMYRARLPFESEPLSHGVLERSPVRVAVPGKGFQSFLFFLGEVGDLHASLCLDSQLAPCGKDSRQWAAVEPVHKASCEAH